MLLNNNVPYVITKRGIIFFLKKMNAKPLSELQFVEM